MTETRFVIIGSEHGPRVAAFQKALADLERQPAMVVGYPQLLHEPQRLQAMLRPTDILRFDSPDRDVAATAALYELGEATAAASGYAAISATGIRALLERRGPIGSPAQLWFGLCEALRLAGHSAKMAGLRLLAAPDQAMQTFDKLACADLLKEAAIAHPNSLGAIAGFDDLLSRMQAAKLSRVFIKLQHGSSAAGMMALALGPRGQMAAYTTATFGDGGELCATRAVQRLIAPREISALVDAMAPLGLLAEQWVAKSGVDGRTSDLRIITVAGEPVFNVMRLSKHPMTNLHLGGERRPPDTLRQRAGREAWNAMLTSCRQVARLFPDCLMLGLDVAILAGDRRHAVLEVNAFGDHVNNVRYQGMSPQGWQILKADDWVPG